MKFSIITPSFNQGHFLADCIESVLGQDAHPSPLLAQASGEAPKEGRNPSANSHEEFMPSAKHSPLSMHGHGGSQPIPPCFAIEHIVTDAGSTDETLDVLRRHTHLKWTSEPDKGMSDGINKGFLQATGDWVMWLNCDDYLLPGALAKVAAHAAAHPEDAVIHGDCVFVDAEKHPIRRKYDTPVDEKDFLFVGCCIPSTATFYRADIIRAGHLLDVSYRNCMDWEYYLRLSRAGYRFGYVPEALAGFRWHEESTTQKHWERMIAEGLRCQREHIAARGLPEVLGNASLLKVLRKIYQVRRVAKRISTHGRVH